jgi:hypothetical protein
VNPDNPNFRTPEEEARAAELVRLKAELADLKWHWQEATKFVMPGEFDTAESIKHYIDTLESENERLKRVVEKLREQRDVLIIRAHPDNATAEQLKLFRANLDAELAALSAEKVGE